MSRPGESAFLLAINPTEMETLRVGVLQDLAGVAVEDGVASPEKSDVAAIPGPCNRRETCEILSMEFTVS
jgi:hypothetical protein